MPAAPTPVTARPAIKAAKSLANAVMSVPMPRMIVDAKMDIRGVKIWLSFPFSGDVLDMAI